MGKSHYTCRTAEPKAAPKVTAWIDIHRGENMKTLSSRVVYRNRWMTVREDAIRRGDGSEGIYGVVEKPEAAMIIPVEDGRVHMVQQYKYAVGGRYWEFPQGTWETAENYSAEELARGELREETGLEPAALLFLGRIYVAYGFLTQPMHVFVATGLTQLDAQPEHEEQDIVRGCFTWDEFHQMVAEGQISDAQTLAGYSLLRMKHAELAG
jgi:ADP-ribose pyrophosphatase